MNLNLKLTISLIYMVLFECNCIHFNLLLQAGLRSLENKNLVLIITSELDIETSVLFASGAFQNFVKIWIPILDYPTLWDTQTMNNHYRILTKQAQMHGVKNLQKSIAPGFARFVKKKFFPTFQTGGRSITVLLDHHGRIVVSTGTDMIVKRSVDAGAKGKAFTAKAENIIIPSLKNLLNEWTGTSLIRDLVFDIDRKISDFAGLMYSNMDAWLLGILSESCDTQNPERFLQSFLFNSLMEKEDSWKEDTWCTKLLIGIGLIDEADKWVSPTYLLFNFHLQIFS